MKIPLSWLKEFLEFPISTQKIADALNLGGIEVDGIEETDGDTIFEISLTPNLGHCMSVLGIARELAALLNFKIKKAPVHLSEDKDDPISKLIAVNVQDKQNCPRYTCRVLKNIRVAPSPDWLKKRLESCGIRSINNIVDVGNFVMLETGQPLHIFDYDTIAEKTLLVNSHSPYQSLQALDEKRYDVPQGTLLICDPTGPLAVAGVIGGADSAVTDKTQNILIESAYFIPQAIRKSSKALGIRTESSQRFEKGIDIEETPLALDKAAALIQQTAGGSIAKGRIDAIAEDLSPKKIAVRLSRVNHLLGTHLSLREAAGFLERLNIHVYKEEGEKLHVQVPSYRNDVNAEIDLIEEIARIYGYNNIPRNIPRHISSHLTDAPLYTFENEVRSRLLGEGLQECITCDLISPFMAELTAEKTSEKALIHVLHPSSLDQSVLRLSLLPGLLQTIKYNSDHQNTDVQGFEVGRIHFKEGETYKEMSAAAIILTGKASPYHWDPKPKEVDFFTLKGMVENLLESLHMPRPQFESSHLHNFHPGRQARIMLGNMTIGAMGEIHPAHLRALDLGKRVYFAEINLHDLLPLRKKFLQIADIAPFPSSERDWTITMQEEVPISHIEQAVSELNSPLLEKILLLDLYKSEQIGKDRKNITFRFVYRDPSKTIAFDTVEEEHAKIIRYIVQKLRL